MDFDVDRNTNDTGDPSLAEMTIKALRILAKNPKGYFLFVEGKSKVTISGQKATYNFVAVNGKVQYAETRLLLWTILKSESSV